MIPINSVYYQLFVKGNVYFCHVIPDHFDDNSRIFGISVNNSLHLLQIQFHVSFSDFASVHINNTLYSNK